MVTKITKDNALWKAELPPERFAILRQAGTEPAWSGALLEWHPKVRYGYHEGHRGYRLTDCGGCQQYVDDYP